MNPDRKSTRLNSSHLVISYAVFCLKKKTTHNRDVSYTGAPIRKARSSLLVATLSKCTPWDPSSFLGVTLDSSLSSLQPSPRALAGLSAGLGEERVRVHR